MPIDAKQRVRKLFRLRTILLMVMLSVLLLPLGSLYFFRFYENVLVQKTEVELITQSAVFAAIYREFIGHNNPQDNGVYTPVEPQLDLSKQPILKRRPNAKLVIASLEETDLSPAQIAGERMQNILLEHSKSNLGGYAYSR